MVEVVGINFKPSGKIYYFDPSHLEIDEQTDVIVETASGLEYGHCVLSNKMVPEDDIVQPLRKVIRIATEDDIKNVAAIKEKEKEYTEIAQSKAEKHELDMKFINAEIAFDNSRILFYFTAEGRIDFRELVRDLASIFHTRIELRQIGVRDEAKLLGGLGICGRPCCCNAFLEDFQPVSIKMAKDQNLSLNPTKISGTCGRLMCCLKYEEEAYEDLHKTTPKIGEKLMTKDGPGTVIEITNLISGSLKIELSNTADNQTSNIKVYKRGEYALPGEKLILEHEDDKSNIDISPTHSIEITTTKKVEKAVIIKKPIVKEKTTVETKAVVSASTTVIQKTTKVVPTASDASEVTESDHSKQHRHHRNRHNHSNKDQKTVVENAVVPSEQPKEEPEKKKDNNSNQPNSNKRKHHHKPYRKKPQTDNKPSLPNGGYSNQN